MILSTLSKTTSLDTSKLKEFADDNFNFDENGGKFSKSLENTVGKGEIAHYEQFLLFSQCFNRTCSAYTEKQCLVWERVNIYLQNRWVEWFVDMQKLLKTAKRWAQVLTLSQTTYFRLFQTERVCRGQFYIR